MEKLSSKNPFIPADNHYFSAKITNVKKLDFTPFMYIHKS
jgi:hypothetical protein